MLDAKARRVVAGDDEEVVLVAGEGAEDALGLDEHAPQRLQHAGLDDRLLFALRDDVQKVRRQTLRRKPVGPQDFAQNDRRVHQLSQRDRGEARRVALTALDGQGSGQAPAGRRLQ